MLQVLERTFRILDLVAAETQRDFALGEIARALELHPATCSHIVKSLVAGGYLEQDAPGRGYRLGPAPYALTRGGPYRKDLVAVVKPVLAELANDLGESLEFSVLRGARRVIVSHIEGGGAVGVREGVVSEDNPYATASGRLLLACKTGDGRDRAIKELGLPGADWPEVKSKKRLLEELDAIAESGCAKILRRQEVVGLACAVRRGLEGPTVGALGLHLPAYRYESQHKERIHSALRFAAAQLTDTIGAEAPERNRVK